jgi:hypothetical protein
MTTQRAVSARDGEFEYTQGTELGMFTFVAPNNLNLPATAINP